MNAPGSSFPNPAAPAHGSLSRLVPYLFYLCLLAGVALMLTLFHGVLSDGVREMQERRQALQERREALQRCDWQPTADARQACRQQIASAPRTVAQALPQTLPNFSTDVEPVINAAYR